MTTQHNTTVTRRIFLASGLALVLSLATISGIASALSYNDGDGDDADVKTAACRLIGCHNGKRECGTVAGTIKAGAPPFVGEVEVEYTCYESGGTA